MEQDEGPYGVTGVVGAAFFGVGVLIILLSTTLPCASGHLGLSTVRKRMRSCDGTLR